MHWEGFTENGTLNLGLDFKDLIGPWFQRISKCNKKECMGVDSEWVEEGGKLYRDCLCADLIVTGKAKQSGAMWSD